MSNITEQVYEIVKRMPRSKVTTYGAIARAIGTSPRVVGNALHRNIDPATIPCHRVVRSDGSIASGYAFGGPDIQRAQLEAEGVHFNGLRVDFARSLWQPE